MSKQEEWFRIIFDNAPIGIDILTPEGKPVYVNPALQQMFGFSEEYMRGRSFTEWTHPDDRLISQEWVARLLKGEINNFVLTKRYIRKDGSEMWGRATVIAMLDKKANVRFLIAMVEDTTEWRQYEKQLQYQANLLKDIQDAIVVSDENFIITSWNTAAEKMYGWTKEEVIGRTGEEIMHTEFQGEGRKKALEEFRRTGKLHQEVTNLRKDGSRINVEACASAVYDRNGHVIGYVSINRDVTRRKKMETALHDSRLLLKQTFEALNEAVFIVDPRTRTISECNQAVKAVFGYSREEVIGRNTEFLHVNQDSYRQFGQALFLVLGKTGIYKSTFQMRRKDGTLFNSEHTVTEIKDESGERTGVVSVIRDISDRIHSEKSLLRIQTLLNQTQSLARIGGWEYDVKTGNIVWTDQVYSIYGMDKNECDPNLVARKNIHYLPEDQQLIDEAFRRAIEVGESFDLILRFRNEAGELLHVRTIGHVEKKAGRTVRIFGNIMDVTELEMSKERAAQQKNELRNLTLRLMNIQEEERKHISRDLHDELGQTLTALAINLSTIEKSLPQNHDELVRDRLTESLQMVDIMSDQLHEMILDLRPSILDDLGLVPTIRWYVSRFRKRTGIKTGFLVPPGMQRVAREIEIVLYRVIQEALTNALKHAEPKSIQIAMTKEHNTLNVTIEDDGRGFLQNAQSNELNNLSGAGIAGMRERLNSVKGSLYIHSKPGKGTKLEIFIPLEDTKNVSH